MSVVALPFRLFNHLLGFITDGGSWALSPREQGVVSAAIGLFSPQVQTLLKQQLEQWYFVERTPGGRICFLRYYFADDKLRIEDPRFGDMLVQVKVAVDGVEQNAHVNLYKGYLFSLEFRHKASRYRGRSLVVLGAKIGRTRQSYTRAIDRSEHGKGED